jgi:hypothetical protein
LASRRDGNDPNRTLIKDYAHHYSTDKEAKRALRNARRYRPFTFAKIVKEVT